MVFKKAIAVLAAFVVNCCGLVAALRFAQFAPLLVVASAVTTMAVLRVTYAVLVVLGHTRPESAK